MTDEPAPIRDDVDGIIASLLRLLDTYGDPRWKRWEKCMKKATAEADPPAEQPPAPPRPPK